MACKAYPLGRYGAEHSAALVAGQGEQFGAVFLGGPQRLEPAACVHPTNRPRIRLFLSFNFSSEPRLPPQAFLEVWGEGSSWEELFESIRAYPAHLKAPYEGEGEVGIFWAFSFFFSFLWCCITWGGGDGDGCPDHVNQSLLPPLPPPTPPTSRHPTRGRARWVLCCVCGMWDED